MLYLHSFLEPSYEVGWRYEMLFYQNETQLCVHCLRQKCNNFIVLCMHFLLMMTLIICLEYSTSINVYNATPPVTPAWSTV